VKRIILAALLLTSCGQSGSPNVEIANAWARETVAGQTSTAAYFTVINKGTADDRLVSVSVPDPAKASVHVTENSGGVSHMREMSSGLALPPGSTIELKPGGTHVMITGLQAPLRRGGTLKLRVRFAKSGEKPIEVRVAPATGPESR
jgi:copper(I)-binding protein